MYLIKQGDAWSVKVTIPKDIRHVFNKVAFKQALKTSDKIEANARAAPLVIMFQKQITEARENPNSSISETLTEAKKRLQELRSKINTASESPSHAYDLANLRETQDAIEGVVSDAILAAKGVADSSELKGQDLVDASETYKVITGQLVPTLDNLEAFIKAQAVEPNTSRRYHQMIHRFAKKHPVASNVTAKSAREYIRHLSEDCSLTPRTVRSHILPLRTYWTWMLDNELLATANANPFDNVKTPKVSSKDAAKEVRFSYETEDIQKLDAAVGFGDDMMLKALFAFGIYTGARREEITQLKLSDITKDYIKIHAAKTRAGNRSVPIHPQLRPVIDALIASNPSPSSGSYLLFDLTTNRDGKRSVQVGKRFSRLKTKLGFDDGHDFHSIRKTVSTQLEQAGVSEGISADILGHEKKTMTYGLYSGGSSMEQKTAAINLIDYELSRGRM
jgi:integrase